ncbi:chalcone isomerase family protein [Polaromonas sp.]|uniref:chalcone isomerase family protein n=1 Tax=Polaromonas sp. TaxID=1869339 RepID=UPI00286C9F66|nr:chalcone isomerase family protein [Polaromonas sp.]
MKTKIILALFLGATLIALQAQASIVEVNGVKLEDRVDIRGSSLQLNGSGVRSKDGLAVYNAALYLSQKAATTDAVLAGPGSKRLSLTMLRDVKSDELGRLFTHRMDDNAGKGSLSRMVPGLIHMGQIFSQHQKLRAGETVTIDWLPNEGILISVKGQAQGLPFNDPEFSSALMKIWLGNSPADLQLKDALLGKRI